MVPETTTVAVVGGGPVGLTCSILLSLQGINHILFERQPGTSIHPKAVGLNQRTIEIFRKMGVEDEVLRQAAPPSMSERTAWYTSFGPNGREICARYAWGGGPYKTAFEKASPCRYVLLPQIRLEPILKRRAMELNPEGIYFGHEVDSAEEQGSNVTVEFHTRTKDGASIKRRITATYALNADGGRKLADQLGIRMNGESNLVDMVSAHFQAPISQHRPDPSIFLHWFISPELGGSIKTGYLYHIGPYPMQTKTEEWVFACARLPHEQTHPFTEEDMLQRLHRTLKIPDLKVELLSLSHWHVNAKVAESYRSREGKIFLVGDAAKRVPPWGALGLNTGIQDADNLIWKLAFALHHPEADCEKLLDTYDSERRPIGERVAKTSLYNMQAHALVLDQAIGLSPEKSELDNIQAMKEYFDPADQGRGALKRHEVDNALKTLDVEFHAHGAEVGWYYKLDYDDAADNPTPQLWDNGEMKLCVYHPSTKPGNQLPHASLVKKSDKSYISTRELLQKDKLTLLAMSPGWRAIQHPLIHTIIINEVDGEFSDVDGTWENICGDLMSKSALLIRPDSIVAYRFLDDSLLSKANAGHDLSKIVAIVLRQQA